MAYDENLAARIRDLLAAEPDLVDARSSDARVAARRVRRRPDQASAGEVGASGNGLRPIAAAEAVAGLLPAHA